MASEKQANAIIKMRDNKDLSSLSQQQRDWLANEDAKSLESLDWKQTNRVFDALKALPWLPRETNCPQGAELPYPNLEDGRYAIVDDNDGKLKFYTVKRWKKNPRILFVSVWASDYRYPIRDKFKVKAILDKIAVNPKAAGERFGQEIGICYVCGRTLTDETSRMLGIGPVCRGDDGTDFLLTENNKISNDLIDQLIDEELGF